MKEWLRNPKNIYRVLLYLSIPFITYYLIKFDYIRISGLNLSIIWLIPSFFFLWAGFIFSAISWKYALHFHNISITNRTSIASHGLAIFAKYIPGKIWVILGRASYISRSGAPLKITSFVSLKEQLLYILLGLIISFIPSLWYFKINYLTILLVITISGLTAILFIEKFHRFFEITLRKILKKDVLLPRMNFILSCKLSLYIVFYWFLWIIAFYCLLKAFHLNNALIGAFAFPLSVSYGVLAIILPGGIGVREGLIVAFLTATGVNTEIAITISIFARLWFMTGEVFVFIVALLLRDRSKTHRPTLTNERL